jgi:hypothetical protein
MGLYFKNVLNKGINLPGDNSPTSLTPNQRNLKRLLGEIWNNQDNLRDEDIKTLEHLSKK